jgi:hypothetical protein
VLLVDEGSCLSDVDQTAPLDDEQEPTLGVLPLDERGCAGFVRGLLIGDGR